MNVPRDMSIWAARRLREALEVTAAIAGGNSFYVGDGITMMIQQ